MYEVVAKYTTGDTGGRSTEIHTEILVTKEDREPANLFAELFTTYIKIEEEYDYSYGKKRKEGNVKLQELIAILETWGAAVQSMHETKFMPYTCLGYFEEIEEILVREQPKPEEKPLLFRWER